MVVGGGEDRGDAGATRDVRINFGRDPAGPAVPSSPGPLRQWEHGSRGPRTPSARLRARTPPIGLSSVVPDAFTCALQGSVSPSASHRQSDPPLHRVWALQGATHLCAGRVHHLISYMPCSMFDGAGATVHASTGVGNPVLPSVDEWRRHAFRHLYTCYT